MINLSEISKDWLKIDDWFVAPTGFDFITEGFEIKVGINVIIAHGSSLGNHSSLGHGSSLGNYSRLGDHSSLGSHSRLGNCSSLAHGSSLGDHSSLGSHSSLGKYSSLGDHSSLGHYSSLGDGLRLGDGSSLGNNVEWVIDLGFADGYRKCLANVNGLAYIGAGCRWFTLDQAIAHWGGHTEDRSLTLCLMESAKAIAKVKGLKFN